MTSLEKVRLAAEAMDRWEDFQERLPAENQKYPIQRFQAFWSVTKRYAELTKSDPLIHTNVAAAVTDLGVET